MSRNQVFLSLFLKVINYLAFYILWVGCLYAAVHELSFIAALIVGGYLLLHLIFVSERSLYEAFFIFCIVVLGLMNDTLLTQLDIIHYVDASSVGPSWWMTGLWACFGSTYWHAFTWLESRRVLSVILGAIAVPFCYLWGMHAKTVTFVANEVFALTFIGLLWAFCLPLTFVMSRAIKRRAYEDS